MEAAITWSVAGAAVTSAGSVGRKSMGTLYISYGISGIIINMSID
jgi:hypothetical protein